MKVLGLAVGAVLVAGLTVGVPQTAMALKCAGGATAKMNSATGKITCVTEVPTGSKGKPGKSGKGSSVKPACVWVPKPDYQTMGGPAEGDGGHYYQRFCSFGAYQTLDDVLNEIGRSEMNMRLTNIMRQAGLEVEFFTTPPEPPRRTPEQVMASVVADLPIPQTYLAVNPMATKQVVGIPTWVWLTDADGKYVPDRYGKKSTEVELEGYNLAWQIEPAMTITPGDGGSDPGCTGAGVPWSASAGEAGACTVTYKRSGNYALTASVGWTVHWWLEGAQQADIAGPTNTATTPVTVLEIQTRNR